jgi:short-subunit dehydrogenase
MKKFDHRGKTALVTGASSGIGAVFARQLAALGSNLVLVARREEKLRELAAEISAAHGIRAEVVAQDLARAGAATALKSRLEALGLGVDTLVNNAGFGTYGDLETSGLARLEEEVALNVGAVMTLTRVFLPTMIERREGAIINVGSTAGFQPCPHMAVYGATKAFVLSFSEALWVENRHRGIRVLCLCPGATDTAFFEVVGHAEAAVGNKENPDDVVRRALAALDRNPGSLISGVANYWLAQSSRLATRGLVAKMAGRMLARPAVGGG